MLFSLLIAVISLAYICKDNINLLVIELLSQRKHAALRLTVAVHCANLFFARLSLWILDILRNRSMVSVYALECSIFFMTVIWLLNGANQCCREYSAYSSLSANEFTILHYFCNGFVILFLTWIIWIQDSYEQHSIYLVIHKKMPYLHLTSSLWSRQHWLIYAKHSANFSEFSVESP